MRNQHKSLIFGLTICFFYLISIPVVIGAEPIERTSFVVHVVGKDYAYDAEEYLGDGITVLRVRFYLYKCERAKSITRPEMARLQQNVLIGIDRYYNSANLYITNSEGGKNRLLVKVEFVEDPERAHLQVKVHTYFRRENQINWALNSHPTVLAHEVSHQLGLPDEYVDPDSTDRRSASSPKVFQDGSLMGDVRLPNLEVKPRHVEKFEKDIENARRF